MSLEENIKNYANLKIKQGKFELVELIAKERANVILVVSMLVIGILVTFFGSFYASVLINDYLKSEHLGFGIVFMFWLLSLLGLLFAKKSIKEYLFEQFIESNVPA